MRYFIVPCINPLRDSKDYLIPSFLTKNQWARFQQNAREFVFSHAASLKKGHAVQFGAHGLGYQGADARSEDLGS